MLDCTCDIGVFDIEYLSDADEAHRAGATAQ